MMARSTVRDDALLDDVAAFPYAVMSYIGPDGYPMSVPTSFRTDDARGVIVLDAPEIPGFPADVTEVNVTFSHVRPQPGVGYDQRRYICVWGRATARDGVIEVAPERSHGWDEDRLHFFELCERSVPVAHSYMQELSRARGEEVKPRLSLPWLVFMATRIPFLTATFVPILLGALVARSHGFSEWWLVVLCLIGGSAIHLGLNVSNDVFDATSGADEANVTPTMFSGGSRMIQYGLVTVRSMAIAAAALYAVGIAIGLYLVAARGIELLWFGIAGVFLSVFYTAPPLRLVHRGLGEVCVALGFGPIMAVGTYFVVAQQLTFEAFYASLPVGILIMLVLYVNQIPDRRADAAAGKNTIVVRLAKDKIVTGYAVAAGAAFALVLAGAAAGIMPAYTLLALGTAPLARKVHRALAEHYDNPYLLMDAMGTNIALHLFTGLLLAAGYAVAVVV